MQTISTIAELDLKLAECDAAGEISDEALRNVFMSFRMDTSMAVPKDPFSAEYTDFQMDFYRHLSGKSYRPENEVTAIDPEEGARLPFPYRTGSAKTTGDHLIAMGFLIRNINLPPGSRIIEFGAGWGNTSIILASLGYDVTVVDIEERFCELIRRRAEQQDLNITVKHTDFFSAEEISEPYDAALFYECFHHCSDHMRMLKALRTAVKPEGRVYFGCEPILDGFPIPWGVRTDGESLWAARSNGWLELGFQTNYFRDALARTGWATERRASNDVDWVSLWTARRADVEQIHSFEASNERLQAPESSRAEGFISIANATATYALFGPYIALDAGEWRVRLTFRPGRQPEGEVEFDVCAGFGSVVLGTKSFDLNKTTGNSIEITVTLRTSIDSVEARLFCKKAVTASIDRLEFIQEGCRVEL